MSNSWLAIYFKMFSLEENGINHKHIWIIKKITAHFILWEEFVCRKDHLILVPLLVTRCAEGWYNILDNRQVREIKNVIFFFANYKHVWSTFYDQSPLEDLYGQIKWNY